MPHEVGDDVAINITPDTPDGTGDVPMALGLFYWGLRTLCCELEDSVRKRHFGTGRPGSNDDTLVRIPRLLIRPRAGAPRMHILQLNSWFLLFSAG